jgi:putative membrane protein
MEQQNNNKILKSGIIAVCIIVPVLVAILIFLPKEYKNWAGDTSFLTAVNAGINSLTSILLVWALVAVKKRNIELHKKLMLISVGLGALFLVCYVIYHSTNESVKYGDVNHDLVVDDIEKAMVGKWRSIYFFILASHILLSLVVLPFVLFAVYAGLTGDNQKHKKIVKFAYPVWLYISVTGVIVYWMIKPYYV